MSRELYYFEYVDKSASEVVATLTHPGRELLRNATNAAVAGAKEFRDRLHVELAGFDVGRDVDIELGSAENGDFGATFPIRWHAASQSSLFPTMTATLEVVPLSEVAPFTQLAIHGTYEPPVGVLGRVGDAVLGHRIAEAAVRQFIRELAERLGSIP